MKSDVMIPGTSPHLTTGTEQTGADLHMLALAVTEESPPADLWSRIDAQLDAEHASPGVSSIRAQDGTWEARPKGVWKKIISTRPDGVQMYLLRCAPGARILGHHHKHVEQVFVLEGEFQMNGVVFGAGDGQMAGANTDHPDIYSEYGCLLLIVA
ncbi:cupin domain-containing protein [Sulfitobacter sp. MF3-043]|uniref:cupin domain-containing protein n=1 Tax=Sulfitobacter sediminivivens TaxID=3252902 RepID=UPI003EB96389